MDILERLISLYACEDGFDWVCEQSAQDTISLWQNCHNGWWMLWWLEENGTKMQDLVVVYRKARERVIRNAITEMRAAGLSIRFLLEIPRITDDESLRFADGALKEYFMWKKANWHETLAAAPSDKERKALETMLCEEKREAKAKNSLLVAEDCRQHLTELFMKTI